MKDYILLGIETDANKKKTKKYNANIIQHNAIYFGKFNSFIKYNMG